MLKQLIVGLSLITAGYAATTASVSERILPNGLQVLVKEDHRAPVVVTQLWYRVGSVDEKTGKTGLSHVLEHMMFKGTKNYPDGLFSKTIAREGGQENAMTSSDFTMYYQKMSSASYETALKLEADRMGNLLLPEDEFTKELEVVKEERRMRIDDNPMSQLYERFLALAQFDSPYQHLPIGWMNDVRQLTNDDLRQYYQMWYVPNNATLIVVGDVNPETVFQLAEKYYGTYPKKTLPPRPEVIGVDNKGYRRIDVSLQANIPVIYLGYNTPSLKTATDPNDAYALEVLAAIMGDGDSSRLEKRLVRDEKIASSVNVQYDLFSHYDGLFLIQIVPAEGQRAETLTQVFNKEIDKLQTTPVSDAELSRVKTQMMADKIYSKDSASGQGMLLGQAIAAGLPWQLAEEYIDKIKLITPQQVQMVAKRYLVSNRLTEARLTPQQNKDK